MKDEQEKYIYRVLWEARCARSIISGCAIADESSPLVSSKSLELKSEDQSKENLQYDKMLRLIESQEETISSLRELLTTLQESLREAQDSKAYVSSAIAEDGARFAALETTLKNSERSKDKLISGLRVELQKETCKMRGVCIKEYLIKFFRSTIEGRTDYTKMLPGVL